MSEKLDLWDEYGVPVESCPKSYRVTSSGNVYRFESRYKKWVKCAVMRDIDSAYVDVEGRWCELSHMVASHFVENPLNFNYVGYRDGDCYNCDADNLFWTDASCSGTFWEGCRDGWFCVDLYCGRTEHIYNCKDAVAIYPSDYEFMPEIGVEYPIINITKSMKVLENVIDNNDGIDPAKIKFVDSREKAYCDVTESEWVLAGVRIIEDDNGRKVTVPNGRIFFGDKALRNVTDNMMMAMFGRIPSNVRILKFEIIKDNPDDEFWKL